MNMPIIAMTKTIVMEVITHGEVVVAMITLLILMTEVMVIIIDIEIMSLILMADIIEIIRKKLSPVDTQITDTRRPRHAVLNSSTVAYMADVSFAIQCAALYMMWK